MLRWHWDNGLQSQHGVNFAGWDGKWLVGLWEGNIPHNKYGVEPWPLDGAPVTVLITRPFGVNEGEGFINYSGYIEAAGRRFPVSVSPPAYDRDDENCVWWKYGEPYQSSGSGHTGYIGMAGGGGEDFAFMFHEDYPTFGDTLTFTFWGISIDVKRNGAYGHISHGPLVLKRSFIAPL